MSRSGQVPLHAVAMLAAVLLSIGAGCGPPSGEDAISAETKAATACGKPGTPCDDGNPCTIGDTCSRQHTCVGTPYSCNDGNVCTNDACDGSGGCTFTNNTASCNDGNACTSGDRCSAGACSGVAYSCDDGNACTEDTCDGAGGCTHTLVASCGSCTESSCPSGLTAPTLAGTRPMVSYVEITWRDNTSSEDGFRIERSRDMGATWAELRKIPANATYAQDYDVSVEQGACYRVFAFDAQGDSAPSETRCTAIPATPSKLAAAAVGNGIELTWTDNSAVEDGYDVERRDETVAYAVVAHLPADAANYRDDNATSDHTYYYFVRATRDGGGSWQSNIATGVVATAAPNAPGGVHAIPLGSTVIGITWTDNSTNEAGFHVERSTDDGASWTNVGMSWFAAYDADQFVDAGRTPEARVCYRVFAYNDAGESPPSPLACTTPPAAPTHLTATLRPEGVALAWTDNSAVEDGYYVVLLTNCSEQPYYWIPLPPNSTSYLDSSGAWCIGPAVAYYVVATKDGGSSDSITIPSPAAISICEDGFWDSDEGDVDCGGSCETKCTSGQHCWTGWDCASGSCVNDVCQ